MIKYEFDGEHYAKLKELRDGPLAKRHPDILRCFVEGGYLYVVLGPASSHPLGGSYILQYTIRSMLPLPIVIDHAMHTEPASLL